MEDHPTSEDFERFLQRSPLPSQRNQNSRIVRHLLGDCPTCHRTLLDLRGGRALLSRLLEIPLPQKREPSRPYNYDWAFARTERAVAATLAQGGPVRGTPEKLAEISRLSEGEQLRRVAAGARFAEPDFIHLLLDRGHAARYQSPKKMLHWSHLARLAAENCTEAEAGGEAALADLQAHAWRAYGNAQRVCGNLQEAERAFANAFAKLDRGSGSREIRAVLLTQVSSLQMAQRQFKEALAFADEAEQISRELGDLHLLARVLVQKAVVFVYGSQTEEAVQTLRQALSLIDPEDDPHLFLAAHHNLARCYIDLDRPDEALATFVEAKPLYQRFKDPLILLRATWQEGLLLREIGHLQNAEAALLRARKGFIEQGLAYEAAMVGLDLADTYSKQGKTEDLRRILEEGMPIFRSLRVERETLASLLRLRQAAGLEEDGQG